jgi:drug/metabolite transporter (DMT)-like permease
LLSSLFMLNRRLSGDLYLRQRRAAWIGLALAIALDTSAQLCWKAATFHAPASAGMWQTLIITFRQPLFYVTVLLIILMFFNWMLVLSNADLSYAQPITALGYVTVSVVAVIVFGENIPPQRMIGIAMILCGVWFISSTRHRTIIPDAQSQSVPQQTRDRS